MEVSELDIELIINRKQAEAGYNLLTLRPWPTSLHWRVVAKKESLTFPFGHMSTPALERLADIGEDY
jgi:hypothetical protein